MDKQDKALSSEQERAIEDANCIAYSDMYFGARSPLMDTSANRNIYEAGFKAAYRAASPQLPVAQMSGDPSDAIERIQDVCEFIEDLPESEEKAASLKRLQSALRIVQVASHHSNAVQDAPACRHQFHYFGDQVKERRCVRCDVLESKTTTVPQVVQAPIAELDANALNDACWAWIDAMPHQYSTSVWNDLKPAVGAAISKYLAQQPVAAPIVATVPSEQKPIAWVRLRSDGCYEGPLMDSSRDMCDIRRRSGAWTPLYAAPSPTEQESDVRNAASFDDGLECAAVIVERANSAYIPAHSKKVISYAIRSSKSATPADKDQA